jgi:hypothetical protein
LLNRLKRKLGITVIADDTTAFLRLFLLHALGRQPRLNITCRDRTDGAGAQAHTIISAMNFAQAFGHTYVHSPFIELAHGDRNMAEWVAGWEELFNFESSADIGESERILAINYSSFHPRLFHWLNDLWLSIEMRIKNSLGSVCKEQGLFHPFFYYSDRHPDSYRTVIPWIQQKFLRDPAAAAKGPITVAVHMRRGDVTAECCQRFTPIEPVCATTRLLQELLDERKLDYSIALYSQGNELEFEELQRLGVELRLNKDAIWTMQQLVEADILVMSKSSFSYVAALVSDGVKLYEPFWHSPMSEWISRHPEGRFCPTAFAHCLDQHLAIRGVSFE